MKRYFLVAAAVAFSGLFIASGELSAQGPGMVEQPPQINISARGEVEVTPDRARVTLGVQTEAKTAQEASQANAATQASILAAIKALGIPESAIRTTGFNVSPNQQYNPDTKQWVVEGYRVSNLVVVTVDPVGKSGQVIDAALKAGANRVAGLEFELKDPVPAREAALAQAVVKARRSADVAAEAAGGRVAELLELSVNEFESRPRPMMDQAVMMRAEASETPIAEGTQPIVVSVNTRWRFAPMAPR